MLISVGVHSLMDEMFGYIQFSNSLRNKRGLLVDMWNNFLIPLFNPWCDCALHWMSMQT